MRKPKCTSEIDHITSPLEDNAAFTVLFGGALSDIPHFYFSHIDFGLTTLHLFPPTIPWGLAETHQMPSGIFGVVQAKLGCFLHSA